MTVSQSVNLAVEPKLGLVSRYLLLIDSLGFVLRGTDHVTQKRQLLYCCRVFYLAAYIMRCIVTVAERTAENTVAI
jgi:hypothetical protein